jgi:hypothetical protein
MNFQNLLIFQWEHTLILYIDTSEPLDDSEEVKRCFNFNIFAMFVMFNYSFFNLIVKLYQFVIFVHQDTNQIRSSA